MSYMKEAPRPSTVSLKCHQLEMYSLFLLATSVTLNYSTIKFTKRLHIGGKFLPICPTLAPYVQLFDCFFCLKPKHLQTANFLR